MTRGQRATLLLRLGRGMSELAWGEMDVVFRTFGFSTWDSGDWSSRYDYALRVLEEGSDDQVLELFAHMFPGEDVDPSNNDRISPWQAGTFRLFLSHTTENRHRAGALRRGLARWGIDAFVAHDTIEPTRDWQETIEVALGTCDALLALLTPDFVTSRWCDQEIGFAVARKVLILPVKLGVDSAWIHRKVSGPHDTRRRD